MSREKTTIYRKGLGVQDKIKNRLEQDYFSGIVSYLKAHDFTLSSGGLTIYLAREFGFCYGVERAVNYAYQTREKFPDRRIFLIGDMIHNPFVNRQLREMQIEILPVPETGKEDYSFLKKEDVVVLPAFGIPVSTLELLKQPGCILVDTTCGSVMSVWKRVESYAKEGYTVLVHGKYWHEETRATVSHALKAPGGKYLVVLNKQEAQFVCDFIRRGGPREGFMEKFRQALSSDFDPDRDLQKIGLANQTTMLRGESMEIAEMIKTALAARFGAKNLTKHFRNFDTVCSATQDRQDAVVELLTQKKVDLMLVVGGFNSSNTGHLAEISSKYVPTFHIENAGCILNDKAIRCRDAADGREKIKRDWLPIGPVKIALTAGASTPSSIIGEVVTQLLAFHRKQIE
ncbi:4-hydroxy-3-methylbut-2-enyl diphosphate reductase [bacterium BMS3Abin05]|nr:4-hydroxy-3-methylbut-2-enyl diphosphate reductase [bacterium BMS3Abin05]GBE26364.1 4-hydroxy-3-methylbut-2-enyl diphosphate reductase [bacterium BMS3Bbin03]HDZ11578.1 4-hydroxy-3-methylbut-2-enyl diphosphate reductase [Bacteroidota bacterium]